MNYFSFGSGTDSLLLDSRADDEMYRAGEGEGSSPSFAATATTTMPMLFDSLPLMGDFPVYQASQHAEQQPGSARLPELLVESRDVPSCSMDPAVLLSPPPSPAVSSSPVSTSVKRQSSRGIRPTSWKTTSFDSSSPELCDHSYPIPVRGSCSSVLDDASGVQSAPGTPRSKRDIPDAHMGSPLFLAQSAPIGSPMKRHRFALADTPTLPPVSLDPPAAGSVAPSVSPLRQSFTTCAGSPDECVQRLEKLRRLDWVASDPRAVQRISEALAAASVCCQGYCRTRYCCKIHWCPAQNQKEEGKASRYHCQHPHEGSRNRGRHHLEYAFYCPDPNCCNGRWFSRDETHNRRHAPRVRTGSVEADKLDA
eukprot:m51a1_g5239 hypothetical protein (366) ;mRNA; f:343244-344829